MAKSKKRKFWISCVIILLVVVILFFPLANSAGAIFIDVNAVLVMLRVESEIMQKTPAGRYYLALYQKHQVEINQILIDNPGHTLNESMKLIQIFAPGLESLLDGQGDTVEITEEQVNSLKAELDWFSSLASSLLRGDIEKEEQRLPLDNFIGMTMSEALDYVNSNWVPGTHVIPLATPTLMPTATASIPICLVGPDASCLEKPTLVNDSDELWAYYILNGVYFEYPSTWKIQQSGAQQQQNALFTVPASNFPEADHVLTLHLFADLNLLKVIKENDLLESPETILMRPSPIWKQSVTLTDFQGVEFFWIDATGYLEVFLYNEQDQIVVDMMAIFKDNGPAQLADDPRTVEKKFPNIQHIIESIRIWKP